MLSTNKTYKGSFFMNLKKQLKSIIRYSEKLIAKIKLENALVKYTKNF